MFIEQNLVVKKKITLFFLVMMLIILPACSCSLVDQLTEKATRFVTGATPQPTATAHPLAELQKYSNEELVKKIEGVLVEYRRAYNNNDLALLQKITDPENLPFKRMVSNRFSAEQQAVGGTYIGSDLKVTMITRLPYGFVRAKIVTDWGASFQYTFKEVDHKWVLSEPTQEQFGEPYEEETDHFTFKLYPWADDINEEIMALMENAADRVEAKLGNLPTEKAKVIILPGYSADPYSDPNALAYYQTGSSDELDRIVIFSPYSYSFGWYLNEDGWQTELEDTLTHEYTHMTHQRAFDKAGKLMDWFSEGLAEYVSDSPRYYEITEALGTSSFIPIVDEASTINQQDLNHIYLLEKDVSLAYAEAESLVWYIHDTYGGMEAVWLFARTHDEVQDMDEALQEAFGIDLPTFNQEWQTWLEDVLLKPLSFFEKNEDQELL